MVFASCSQQYRCEVVMGKLFSHCVLKCVELPVRNEGTSITAPPSNSPGRPLKAGRYAGASFL
ncbi:MAG: hypothetical protein IKB99_00380 [Lentisphaeria bacterium]|nr:hypothetical protein [Lentisphaeria bacterium]